MFLSEEDIWIYNIKLWSSVLFVCTLAKDHRKLRLNLGRKNKTFRLLHFQLFRQYHRTESRKLYNFFRVAGGIFYNHSSSIQLGDAPSA